MESELQITTTDRAILGDRGVFFEDDGVFFPEGTIIFPQEIITTFSSGATRTLRYYQLPAPHLLEVSLTCFKQGSNEVWEMSIPTKGVMAFTIGRPA